MKFTHIIVIAFLFSLIVQTGCTATGAAVGAGAAVGVGAAREGGLKSTGRDLKIKALINDKWFKYNLETFAKLNVTVNQGRVLITGVVQSPEDRVEAIRLAWQVEGVEQIINEIQIAESAGFKSYVRDQWITAQLRTKLTFDRDVQSINYSIDTVRGIIYLMGIAQDRKELNKVIEVARTVPHVTQVVSYVKMAGEGETVDEYNNQVYSEPLETQQTQTETIQWNDNNSPSPDYDTYQSNQATGAPARLTPVEQSDSY